MSNNNLVSNQVLSILIEHFNEELYYSLISKHTNININDVVTIINSLSDAGYTLEIYSESCRLKARPTTITANRINNYLENKTSITVLDMIDSTNTYLKANCCNSNEIVVALGQSQGKGRRGKTFVSTYNKGIYFSFIRSQDISIMQVQFYTICTVISICRTLKQLYGIDVDIKWLNDIYYQNKKLCGILLESKIQGEKIQLITGIGLNTSTVESSIKDFAISLEEILSFKVCRSKLIANIINNYDIVINEYRNLNQKNELLNEYRKMLFIINKEVTIEDGDFSYHARVVNVDNNGHLIVEKNGEILYLNNANVSLKLN